MASPESYWNSNILSNAWPEWYKFNETLKKIDEGEKRLDIKKFLIECVKIWENAELWWENPNNEEVDATEKDLSDLEDWWITEEFVDFICSCEATLDEKEIQQFREDFKTLIIKLHTISDKTEFMNYLNAEFINKWEVKIKNIEWFREKLNKFFKEDEQDSENIDNKDVFSKYPKIKKLISDQWDNIRKEEKRSNEPRITIP
jgi:hypothetical protein